MDKWFVVTVGAVVLALWGLCALAGESAWWVMGPALAALVLATAREAVKLKRKKEEALREAYEWHDKHKEFLQ